MNARTNDHGVYVLHLAYYGGFQAKCVCGFASEQTPTRDAAIRAHTIHAAPYAQILGAAA